jgi:hypothetical protein
MGGERVATGPCEARRGSQSEWGLTDFGVGFRGELLVEHVLVELVRVSHREKDLQTEMPRIGSACRPVHAGEPDLAEHALPIETGPGAGHTRLSFLRVPRLLTVLRRLSQWSAQAAGPADALEAREGRLAGRRG